MSYVQGEYPIIGKKSIAKGIYDYKIACPEIAENAVAGQFVNIRVQNHTLRRPISICEIDKEKGTLRIVFEVRGSGTNEMANLNVGDTMDIMGPLGNNGFALLEKNKKAVVIGGGIGVPPMVEVAKHYGKNCKAILGFRSADVCILEKDFEAFGTEVILSTDDGTKGRNGFVTDSLKELLKSEKPDIIYACGPKPMIKALTSITISNSIRCQVSMEERMGCGVGACLVCACKIAAENGDVYKHVCKDGPVFEAEEVRFDD
ncbi:MAG: dihydroorotate dehydrogenase electron transfer subunit [Oscillospiraceae bacterium]